ncbi:hypothetical protein MCBMB27_02665 [Methylobacterium phyllosphaerae]|uniref:DNA polymerase III, epsilon subunit n=1 Tax=Methylobacterium phyllosphaerae TaxID=418223 RepID=A0AAE8L6W9_9HYPH|nr:3'-5' exonuclease [Methylobacterium phyllosphaerae]APT31956.1 hypothetical protein MCBMB27_02665 [Methylobacterium phyllosphaerae]SFH00929.1 DNA polymerase III, epsilon subunit [Methylobacterium phyllosphaerae]
MRDVMIDLETLSTRPDAMIRSIGAVAFGPDGLGAELSIVIDPAGAVGHIDPETVAWWLGQSGVARHVLSAAYPGERVPLAHALQRFCWFLNDLNVPPAKVRVWGHGSSFDLPIIESAFRACGHPIPWNHSAARDTRTILELAEVKIATPEAAKHDALGDARAQALAVIEAARILGSHRLWPEAAV